MVATQTLDFDPLTEAFANDPHRVYRHLRQLALPVVSGRLGVQLLAKYQHVKQAALSPACVRSLAGYISNEDAAARQRAANFHDMPYHERVVQFSLLDSDGETHRRLRQLVFGHFTKPALRARQPRINAFVSGLLEDMAVNESIDFVETIAAKIPGLVMCDLFGAPLRDAPLLRDWSDTIVAYFDVHRSAARKAATEAATRDFYHYLIDLSKDQAGAPDTLVGALSSHHHAGQCSQDEFVSTAMLIVMAGHGSTTDMMATGLHLLLQHADHAAALRADPSLWPGAIEEMFRFDPPLPYFHRHVIEDIEIGGHFVEAGTTLGLLYAAAGRDPDFVARADTFDIHRPPTRHLAFGQGAHLCLGNQISRMVLQSVFQTLFTRTSGIRLDADEVVYRPGLTTRGPLALPIVCTA